MLLRIVTAAALSCASTAAVLAAAKGPAEKYQEMVAEYARAHGIPEKLVHRVIVRESGYNAKAMHHRYWGLMQITYPTAKSMGYKGKPAGLLDPEVNLTYAVPYLANAYMVAGGDENRAVRLYASGYYVSAKKARMLAKLRTADSAPVRPDPIAPQTPAAQPSLFAIMFGASPSISADQYVATADLAATVDDGGEDAAPVLAEVPLPPHRPRHLGHTVTARR
ncbi:MAG: lytic transglycosylase domain-containing protein [Methylobacteriaceae bacterium]|nr:lytic transglycosylase domain-containing protein [Methylobacteriaceae bacterium]